MKEKLVYIIVGLGLMASSCMKDEDLSLEPFYNFQTEAIVHHKNETIALNDTLWVSALVNGSLYDADNEDTVYIDAGQMNTNFIVKSWDASAYNFNSGAYSFKMETPAQYTSQLGDATMLGFDYEKTANVYRIRFGIVFKKPGIYSVDTDLMLYQYPTDSEAKYYGGGSASIYSQDSAYMFGTLTTFFAVDDNNKHLYDELPDEQKMKFEAIGPDEFKKYFFISAVE